MKTTPCRQAAAKELRPRVARWYIFIPKMPFLMYLEGLAMENSGIFYGRLVYFMNI
jgi:hypothetical protein